MPVEIFLCRSFSRVSEIFDLILFNYDLMQHADDQGQLSITKHWARNLIPFAKSLALSIPSFSSLLAVVSLYRGSESPSLHVRRIREQLLKAAIQIPPAESDVAHLISDCLTAQTDFDAIEIIGLIRNLASRKQPAGISRAFEKHGLASLLFFPHEGARDRDRCRPIGCHRYRLCVAHGTTARGRGRSPDGVLDR
jgi:hypothetical protein